MLLIISALILALLAFLKLSKKLNFWKEKGVNFVEPTFLLGNMVPLVLKKKCLGDMLSDIYQQYPEERYIGIYQMFYYPTLLIKDPELIKQITVKDFDYFSEHRDLVPEDVDPLWANNLFAMRVDKWRVMRPTLSPLFTSSKMKFMFTLMSECADDFAKHFYKQGDMVEVDLKDVFTRFTNDVIATAVFGLKCDSLREPENEFYLTAKDATDFSGLRAFKFLMSSLSPWLSKKLNLKVFDDKVATFFRHVIKDTITAREVKGIVRPDMIHLMLEARKGKKHERDEAIPDTGFATVQETSYGKESDKRKEITDDDITAQAIIFFVGGFDTASALMCYVAYELAVNPMIQDKLRTEIDETYRVCEGKVTYEALAKMKYMDMIMSETLRKWPPFALTDRITVKPYTIQPTERGEKPIHLEKGSLLWIPIFSIHRDPKNFPDPEKFDPERFNEENKDKITPYTYIPFGSGPRNCIGSRFAILENKLICFHILRNFKIVPTEKTPVPVILHPGYNNLTPRGSFCVGLERR